MDEHELVKMFDKLVPDPQFEQKLLCQLLQSTFKDDKPRKMFRI